MSAWPKNPILYEINTRVWLAELSRKHGRPIRLDTVPQEEIERLKEYHLDALWLMGVWSPSPAGRRIAREHPDLQPEFHQALDDLEDEVRSLNDVKPRVRRLEWIVVGIILIILVILIRVYGV